MRLATLVGFIAIQCAMVALFVPLLRGRIARNRGYGLRTPETLASDEVWYHANRAVAKRAIASAVILTLAALGFYALDGTSDDELFWILLVLWLAALIQDAIAGVRFARRLAQAAREAEAEAGRKP